MKLIKSKNYSENYLSKIVQINFFKKHSDPEVTRLKCATVDGFNIITDIDSEPGLYIYFPALSEINPDFLSYANLYRNKERNTDTTKAGMFEENGRVTAIRLRGELSEGFILPIEVLQSYVISVTNQELTDITEGLEFDTVEHNGKEFWISKKYIRIAKVRTPAPYQTKKRGKHIKKFNKLIDSQFKFHYDTVIYKKVPNAINPDDPIELSHKWHGTSAIFANILCHKKLSWKEKVARWLTGYQFDHYDNIYASRSVIKNKYYNPNVSEGFYNSDVWGEANKIVAPLLSKGITVYAEIVGFLPSGGYIQKNYDYGCVPPKGGKYIAEHNYKIRVYRVTYTNVDGEVFEFTPLQVQQWCYKVGLIPVTECWAGVAKDLYPEIPVDENWGSNFIERLSNDGRFYMEKNSPDCNNKVPHEGLVIKNLNKLGSALKLKCFAFLGKEQKELDKEGSNIEDEA